MAGFLDGNFYLSLVEFGVHIALHFLSPFFISLHHIRLSCCVFIQYLYLGELFLFIIL